MIDETQSTETQSLAENALQDLLHKLQVDRRVPLPDSSIAPRIDTAKVDEWLANEPDEDIRAIKVKLVGNIEQITTARFLQALSTSARDIRETLGDKPYAVMFGDKPHASQRWVYSLSKNVLTPASLETWFKGDLTPSKKEELKQRQSFDPDLQVEPPTDLTNLDALAQVLDDRGIATYLFMDDIVYTGLQMNSAVSEFIHALKQTQPGIKPNIIIYSPASTHQLQYTRSPEFRDANIVFVPSPINLRTVGEILSRKDQELLRSKRFGRLNIGDEKRFPMDACLAFADHRAPDHWTFPNPIASPLGIMHYSNNGSISKDSLVPYKRTETEYFKAETQEFSDYTTRFVKK